MSKQSNAQKSAEKKAGRNKETSPPPPPVPGSVSVFGAFLSNTYREARVMRKHVLKLLNHQRDILPAADVAAIEGALKELEQRLATRCDEPAVESAMEKLGDVAGDRIRPYPNAAYRENVEVFLVALAVAMGIRTFFLQPFKIPTGSMQPTLYGVMSVPDYSSGRPMDFSPSELEPPKGWGRVKEWFAGVSYLDIKAKVDGDLEEVSKPFKILIFSIYQYVTIGGVKHWILFPPDYGGSTLEGRAGLSYGPNGPLRPIHYNKGDQVVKMRCVNGDHLFVDRLTYNFRPPKRGEIVVFETKGIPTDNREAWHIPPDQFYIKRLVGLGGERIQIGADRHLVINGKRLDASTPHFEKVYGFNPNEPPRESHYSGHVDDNMSPYFQGKPDGVEIPPGDFMVMGDNTMNSLDSRYWGYFPSTAVIGKSFFVYWPFSDRFGWGYHR